MTLRIWLVAVAILLLAGPFRLRGGTPGGGSLGDAGADCGED